MSKLVEIVRTCTVIAGTAFATYEGIVLGREFGEHLPQVYMLPQAAQGLTAFVIGKTGNAVLGHILRSDGISDGEARSVSALNAFASAKNEDRGLTAKQSLEAISNNLVEVYAVVGNERSVGSGLMVTTDGYVMTARHVIDCIIGNDGTTAKDGKIRVKTQKGRTYSVSYKNVWSNRATDIAILKATVFAVFPSPVRIKVDQDGRVRRGEEIRVLGFRDGQKYNTIGIVTNENVTWNRSGEPVYDLFQTDARGLQGQSGGVIVNGDGELTGIVVYSRTAPGESVGVIGGAKISNALNYINQIAAKRSAKMFRQN